MDMDFKGLVWKRVWIITVFLVRNRVRISRTRRHTPTKNSQEHTPGSPKQILLVMPHEFFIEFNQYFLLFQSEGNDRMASMDTKITVKRLLMWSFPPKPEKNATYRSRWRKLIETNLSCTEHLRTIKRQSVISIEEKT